MFRQIFILIYICFPLLIWAADIYRGFHVYTAYVNDHKELQFLYDKQQLLHEFDIWHERVDENWSVALTFHVSPLLADEVRRQLNDRHIYFQTITKDLQRDIDESLAINKQRAANDTFDRYHTYDEIMTWLDEEALTCGSRCSVIDIGQSYEGRPLKVMKITGAPNGCTQKQTVWIDAGIHAREWIAFSTGMYLIDRLIREYDTDMYVRQLVDTYDWHILTAINADGYAYTWDTDRLWRKTRQPVQGAICVGTDANRNFDFMWMTIGASDQPCSETFAGPSPFSEPEAQAVADYVLALNGTWQLFLTLHSYGQLFMSPWGYTQTLPPDYSELERVGSSAVNAIANVHGTVYRFGAASSILYESSGTSRDWAKGVPKIPYVYTIELRNTQSFVLPPDQIRPTGEEIWEGVKDTMLRIQENIPGGCAPTTRKHR